MQVEEAEAARKKAQEEAAAARRRAEEETAARRRAEEEAAARGRTQVLDEERIRRIQADEAERQRKLRLAEEAEQARRVEEARKGGGWGLRLAGNLTIAAGCVVIGSMLAPAIIGGNAGDKLKSFNGNYQSSDGRWTTSLDDAQRRVDVAKLELIALAAAGSALIVAGSILYSVGARRRAREVEAAKRPVLSLAPLVGPQGAALGVVGRF